MHLIYLDNLKDIICNKMELPNELIIEISSYLKINDIFSNRLISKDWYYVSNDDVLWSKLMKRDFNRHKPNKNKEFYIFTYNYLLDKISIKFNDIEKHCFSTLEMITYIEEYGFVRKKNKWIFHPNIDMVSFGSAKICRDKNGVLSKLLSNYFRKEGDNICMSIKYFEEIYDFINGQGSYIYDYMDHL